jgi:lysophospholipase L1-like esterase
MADKVLHVHDDLLGYVPRAGIRGTVSNGGAVTIDADGLRFSGKKRASKRDLILAVGDSYTYGEDVGDLEAWPAQLQELLGIRVLNGAVSGYGFDQIVLRAEKLAALHKPSIMVVSFIADDIRRTEMSRLWWYDKPWFKLENGELILEGVPVPNRSALPLRLRRVFERILIQLPPFLQQLLGYHVRVHPAGHGQTIACRLVERLAILGAAHNIRIVVMAQYDPRAWSHVTVANEQRGVTQAVLGCAAAAGLRTLDTFQRLAAEPRPHEFYDNVHMNARGNSMIARHLAANLRTIISGEAQ